MVNSTFRARILLSAAAAIALSALPAYAQLPRPQLPPPPASGNENEQHLADLSAQADTAIDNARAAADHCNPKGIADAVEQLEQLEQDSRRAAAAAHLSGKMSLVRPDFADAIHKHIKGVLDTARALKATCPQNQPQPGQTAPPPTNPPPPPPPPPQPTAPGPNASPQQPHDVLDEIEDQADDAEDELYKALHHCDRDGMKRALDKFRELAERAKSIAEAARAAQSAGLGRIDPRDAEDLADDLLDFIDEASTLQPRCPVPELRPQMPCPPGTQPQKTSLRSQWTLDRNAFAYLTLQNFERAEVGVPPLQWNRMLADHALSYAGELARTGDLAHAPREGRGIERENLSKGLMGWGPRQMVHNWIAEKANFTPGAFPNVSTTGDWASVGHYSQIIWPATTEVGCGMAAGGGFQWLVCRYSPGGNKDGQMVGYPCGEENGYKEERGR